MRKQLFPNFNTWLAGFSLNYRMLLKIPQSFLFDPFNQRELNKFCDVRKALQPIIKEEYFNNQKETIKFYLLMHRRYIMEEGLHEFYRNCVNKEYGTCQNAACKNYPLVPYGESDWPDINNTFLYCFQCGQNFSYKLLDGCAFGKSIIGMIQLIYKIKDNGKRKSKLYGFNIELNENDN